MSMQRNLPSQRFHPPNPFDSSGGQVFLQDGFIYYSPNCKRTTTIPPQKHAYAQPFATWDDTAHNQPVWWTNAHGWRSFTPLAPSFADLPFEALSRLPQIELDSTDRASYCIASEDSRWRKCEDDIVGAGLLLQLKYATTCSAPPRPSSLGCLKSYPTQAAAKKALDSVRNCFVLWMGFLSFLIAQSEAGEAHHPAPHIPTWYQYLLSHGFGDAWLSGLNMSTVCSFGAQTPRAGMVVQITQVELGCPRPEWFRAHDIPIFLLWTKREEEAVKRSASLAYLAPPPHLLQDALTFIFRDPEVPLATLILKQYLDPDSSNATDDTSQLIELRGASGLVMQILEQQVLAEYSKFGKSDPRDTQQLSLALLARRQRLVQSPHAASTFPQGSTSDAPAEERGLLFASCEDYFTKRRKRQEELEKLESSAERQQRLEQEKARGVLNAAFYEWQKVTTPGGKDVYMRVKKDSVDDILSNYKNKEIFHDPFTNEWDLCHHLSSIVGDFDGAEEEPVEGEIFMATVPLPIVRNADADHVLNEKEEGELDSLPDLLDSLYYQYGFLRPLQPMSLPPNPRVSWKQCLRTLGFMGLNIENTMDIDPGLQTAIHLFVNSFVGKIEPNAALFDLNEASYGPISVAFDFSTIERLQGPLMSTISPPGEETLYAFTSLRSEACPWTLAATSCATALYIARLLVRNPQNATSSLWVARRLLRANIPFRTLISIPLSPFQEAQKAYAKGTQNPSTVLSHIRSVDYTFVREDFEQAMGRVRALLRVPHARAALLMGGIVARVAREYMSPDACLDGPSVEVMSDQRGVTYYAASELPASPIHNRVWMDDYLADHEIAIICGTYHLRTGMGMQTATKSWFPHPLLWNNPKASDLCSVEWTPASERFFEGRLKEIREEGGQPLSQTEWRDRLHQYSGPRNMHVANSLFAGRFQPFV